MRVLVDTSVWSIALKPGRSHPSASKLRHMIVTGDQVFLVGVIMQEVLQGLVENAVFDRVSRDLEAFEILPLDRQDYVEAAQLYRRCRAAGLTPGTVDCLLATAAQRHDCFLLTTDADFEAMTSHCDLRLL